MISRLLQTSPRSRSGHHTRSLVGTSKHLTRQEKAPMLPQHQERPLTLSRERLLMLPPRGKCLTWLLLPKLRTPPPLLRPKRRLPHPSRNRLQQLLQRKLQLKQPQLLSPSPPQPSPSLPLLPQRRPKLPLLNLRRKKKSNTMLPDSPSRRSKDPNPEA